MWKSLAKASLLVSASCILSTENVMQQSVRTTFILKRRVAPFLHKKGAPPKKLRSKHYVYDLVKDTDVEKKPNIEVILTSYVDSLGNAGDRVSVSPHFAYNQLLLPGLAVYATPENTQKYQNFEKRDDAVYYSSVTVLKIMEKLSRMQIAIVMNKDTPWTLQPWHIRTSFRKAGIIVPENAIELPSKPVKGPDMNIEGKLFFVTITINNTEKVKVQCYVHHWSTNIMERLPYDEEGFWKKPRDFLFPDDVDLSKNETQEKIN